MVYVNCPTCGKRLLEIEECTEVRIKCAGCKKRIVVQINNGDVSVKTINKISHDSIKDNRKY